MREIHKDIQEIFNIDSEETFNQKAIELYQYQSENNPVYKEYLQYIKKSDLNPRHYTEIPFLPISFFKTHRVSCIEEQPEIVFSSSGTTGMVTSQHLVHNCGIYIESFRKAFKLFYPKSESYCILALLPSYLERKGSSLIYMVEDLIRNSNHPESGFYLYEHAELKSRLMQLEAEGTKTILFGVSFALLDFFEQNKLQLKHTTIIETGGMKGRRKEMIRQELHHTLSRLSGLQNIHSEYGMTELLSQAYSQEKGIFKCPPWMKVLARDPENPLELSSKKHGAINIIDLANVDSCAFIASQDLGTFYPDGSFEIMGRFDHSDIRGCNLMVAN